ncbi:CorA family divalent cation transporter [Streptomyces sp. NPDC021212]|uniref:CorA family divalent cation transporter n=1 Tax=Streptomyces sp. NPDC021212 TaxID=3365118 RepID=UPI003791164F
MRAAVYAGGMRCVIYRELAGEPEQVDCRRAGSRPTEVLDALKGAGEQGFCWVHLDEPHPGELEELADPWGLHPLAVEDAVQAHQRPKRERYGDVLAVALKTLWYVEDGCEVETGEVMVFTGPRFALTVRHGPVDATVEAARRLNEDAHMLRFGPVAVLHAVLDTVVDSYAEAAVQVRTDLTALERRVFSPDRGSSNSATPYSPWLRWCRISRAPAPDARGGAAVLP